MLYNIKTHYGTQVYSNFICQCYITLKPTIVHKWYPFGSEVAISIALALGSSKVKMGLLATARETGSICGAASAMHQALQSLSILLLTAISFHPLFSLPAGSLSFFIYSHSFLIQCWI